MGDNLAQLLYEAYRSSLADPSTAWSWGNIPSTEREAWEAVATKARRELHQRFVRDMRDATEAFGAEQAIANLLEAAR